MRLSHLISLLFCYTSLGMFLSFSATKPLLVGRKYFLYHGLGLVVLGATGLVIGGSSLDANALNCFVTFLVLALIYSFTSGTERKPIAVASFVLGCLSGAAYLYLEARHHYTIEAAMVSGLSGFVINAGLATLLIGFSLAAMLLGHWYLTDPKLSIDELGRTVKAMIAILVVRCGAATFFIFRLLSREGETDWLRYFMATTPGLFIMMRWLWGLALPLGLSYFLWETVRLRSTQSATGLLYVLVLAVLTGEILGLYLTLTFGVPL